jgi:hypothetical protein
MVVPAIMPPYHYIMRTAWKAFPCFHQIVYQQIDAQPDHTKTKVMQNIGQYLTKLKHTVKIICEYLYGISRSQNAVAKRKRMFEPGDLLDLFEFFQVVAENGTEEIQDSAALTIASSFWRISEHYTYTLCKDENQCMQKDDGPINVIDSVYNSGELLIGDANDQVN